MADPLDILTGTVRRQSGGDEWGATLANLANVLASIPERKARMEQQRERMEQQRQESDLRSRALGLREAELVDEQQVRQRSMQMNQAVDAIVQGAMVDGANGGKVLDRKRLMDGLAKSGLPPDHPRIAAIVGSLDKADENAAKSQKERLGHVADLLDSVLEHGGDEESLTVAAAYGKANGWIKDEDLAPIFGALAAGKDIKPILSQIRDSIRGVKEKPKPVAVAPGSALVNPDTGQPIYTAPKPETPQRPVSVSPGGTIVDPATGKVIFKAPSAPSSVSAPHVGTAEDYIRRKFGANPTPDQVLQGRKEFSQADDPDKSAKPPTGQQRRALGFFNRAKEADDNLNALEGDVSKMGMAESAWMKHAWNPLQSETGQKYNQAQRAFTEARLRKDSGATIKDSEYESDRKTFFAEPGDSAAVLEQKRRARAAQLASLAAESGASALREFYGEEGDTLVDHYRGKSAKTETKKNPFR